MLTFMFLNKVHGLCGNYNGKKKDDLELVSGEIADNFDEFVTSYQVWKCSSDLPPPVTCSKKDRKKWFVDTLRVI